MTETAEADRRAERAAQYRATIAALSKPFGPPLRADRVRDLERQLAAGTLAGDDLHELTNEYARRAYVREKQDQALFASAARLGDRLGVLLGVAIVCGLVAWFLILLSGALR